MAGRVRIVWNEPELANLLYGPTGAVVRHVAGITTATTAIAKTLAPVDTGILRASIEQDIDARPGRVTGTVGSRVDYALFQHEGTGVYGPRRLRTIRPVRSQFLVFRGRDGRWVFAREVKGVRPVPFLTDALRAASPYPVVDVDR